MTKEYLNRLKMFSHFFTLWGYTPSSAKMPNPFLCFVFLCLHWFECFFYLYFRSNISWNILVYFLFFSFHVCFLSNTWVSVQVYNFLLLHVYIFFPTLSHPFSIPLGFIIYIRVTDNLIYPFFTIYLFTEVYLQKFLATREISPWNRELLLYVCFVSFLI